MAEHTDRVGWHNRTGLVVALFVCFGVVVLLFCRSRLRAAFSQPHPAASHGLECAEPVWNLGEVAAGQRLSHEFTLLNRSKQRIRIGRVSATCGCVAVNLHGEVVPPGDAIALPVEISLADEPNEFRHQVLVVTEPPHDQRLVLGVQGETLPNPSLRASRSVIDFGTFEGESPQSLELIVSRHDGSPVEFQALTSSKGALSVIDVAQSDDGPVKTAKLTLRLDGSDLETGRFNATAVLRTLGPSRYSKLEIPVRAHKLPPRTGLVERVFLASLKRGQEVTVSLLAKVRSIDGLEIVQCQYDGPGNVTVRLKGNPSDPYRVTVIRSSDCDFAGLLKGSLIVQTRCPEQSVTIPVIGAL